MGNRGTIPTGAARAHILVTGGGTMIGDAIAAALLAEGAEVTLLVRPDTPNPADVADRLGSLADRARWFTADVWDPASLKGRGRGHDAAIHTIGGMRADPAQGLTYQYLNVVSARNVAHMCVNSGVGHLVLISAARAPWLNAGYLAAKRESEAYLARMGLSHTIIRAPLVYVRGRPRALSYRLLSWLRILPPFGWLGLNAAAPMPLDIFARGVARVTLERVALSQAASARSASQGSAGTGNTPDARLTRTIYGANTLRRRNTWRERRRGSAYLALPTSQPRARRPIDRMDDDDPFGWTPP
jgi:uncharacterized protein YbjT (DUF2867 family)